MKHTKIITLSLLLGLAAGCAKKTSDEHFQAAQQFLNEKNVQSAVIELKSAIQLNPENGKYRLLLAEIAMSIGDVATADKEYEKAIADMNRSIDTNIETIFLTCLPKFTSVASTLVRDVLHNGGDVTQFLPDVVKQSIKKNK